VTSSFTATHAAVAGLAARIEHVGDNFYMDNFISSPALFDDIHTKATAVELLDQIKKGCHRILDIKWK
jgi:hypothetical protein